MNILEYIIDKETVRNTITIDKIKELIVNEEAKLVNTTLSFPGEEDWEVDYIDGLRDGVTLNKGYEESITIDCCKDIFKLKGNSCSDIIRELNLCSDCSCATCMLRAITAYKSGEIDIK